MLWLDAFSYSYMQLIVIPVLPKIQAETGVSQSTISWLVTGFLLSAAVCTPLLGRIGDRLGKRNILALSLAALCLGALLAGSAGSIEFLIAGRVIQGAASAVIPLTVGIARDTVERHRVAGTIGAISSSLALGGGLGLITSQLLISHFPYEVLFLAPLALVVPGLVLTVLVLPADVRRNDDRVSWSIALVMCTWLTLLLLGITCGPEWGWLSPEVVAFFALSAATFVLWVILETRAVHPLIDLSMLRHPVVWRMNAVAFVFGMVYFPALAFMPKFVEEQLSGDPATVGAVILPSLITISVVGLFAGWLDVTLGSRITLTFAGIATAASFYAVVHQHEHEWQIFAFFAALGLGVGLTTSGVPNTLLRAVAAEQTGAATGMNANFRTVGGALGTQVAATVLASQQVEGHATLAAWDQVLLALGTASLVAAGIAASLPREWRSGHPAHAQVDYA